MYVVRRILSMLLTLWISITIVFVLFRLIPGDPASAILGPLGSTDAKAALTQELGLDQPLLHQYWTYITGILHGDLGTSYIQRASVSSLVFPAFLNTFILVFCTFVLAYGLGALFGVYLAWYRGTAREAVGTFMALVMRGAPSFWIALMGLTIFGVQLGWLPVAGMTSSGTGEASLSTYLSTDFLLHLILPVTAATIYALGLPLLLVRNTMLDVLGTPYMELAEAKGLSTRRVMFRHGGRNSMLPAINASGQFIAWAMGGMVVIENVFSWPGLGSQIVNALTARDYILAQGALLLIAVLVVTLNFVADLLSARLDPRVDLG